MFKVAALTAVALALVCGAAYADTGTNSFNANFKGAMNGSAASGFNADFGANKPGSWASFSSHGNASSQAFVSNSNAGTLASHDGGFTVKQGGNGWALGSAQTFGQTDFKGAFNRTEFQTKSW